MEYILSSGDIENGIILENDTMTILDGGIANTTTVKDEGEVFVSSGGTANSTTVDEWGTMLVSNGGTANYTTLISNNAQLFIVDGGTAINTTVKSGGELNIESDGTANYTTVNDGSLYVSSGGTAINTTVNSAGELDIESGGTANSTTVNDGGSIEVRSGGTATEIVENGGYVDVQEGANVMFAPNTFSGLVLSNASATIHSGTTANSTTVNSWGIFNVASGGTANSTTVNDRGRLYVASGGTAKSTTVNDGGRLFISSGGTANEIIENGGYVVVEDGTNAVFASNTFSGLALSNTRATVHSGTTANSTAINSEGSLLVYSGGSANNTTINDGYGDLFVFSGGTANCTTVNGGVLFISSGGSANSTTVNSGGVFVVSNGGSANSTTVNDLGVVLVDFGGTANSTTVNSGGRLEVSFGGSATEITENGGYVNVQKGANVTFAPNTFSGLILSNASATIHSGTTADNTTVNNGGQLYVYNGGTATDIVWTPCEGHVFVLDGGYATFVSEYSGVYYGSNNKLLSSAAVMDGNTLDSAYEMNVMNGGSANSTVNNGGWLYVSSGGIVTNTTVNGWGLLDVSSGGVATITTVNAYGTIEVYSDGVANSTTVNSRGYLYVSSGGMANSTTVNSDGRLYVYSGGTVNGVTVNSGGAAEVSSGGKATGKMTFESEAVVSMYQGAILDFDLTQVEAGEVALVNDLSIIQGTPVYTLTVDADSWKMGSYVYALADGAADFSGTITVKNTYGADLGVLTVGETVKIGYVDYTLNLNEGALTVTVDVPDLPPTAPDGLQAIVSEQTVALLWNVSTDEESGVKEYVVTYSLDGQDFTVRTQNTHYVLKDADIGTWRWSVRAVDFAGNESEISVGEAFTVSNFEPYIVEYSTDSFEHVLRLKVSTDALDSFRLPTGTYEWRIRSESVSDWQTGDPIVSVADSTPTFVQSDGDGNDDLFFANPCGVWEVGYIAQHVGSIEESNWGGTQEYAAITGKNKFADIFEGSDDANILLLTDDANGDALFVDDIYTELPGTLEEQQARIAQISDIRGGAGDDIIDMTSQRFEYIGDGISLHGGDGNDVLWANKGENWLFGDLGDDRLVGASDDDLIVGGAGDDRMHGGGGNDVFTFCEDWGKDTVEHLATGSVTLWFASGDESKWNANTLTYTDGENSVTVKGVTAGQIELKFGDDGSEMFAWLAGLDAFEAYASRKIFEEAATGTLASPQ